MNDLHVMDMCSAVTTLGYIIGVSIFGAGAVVAAALMITHGVV